MAEKAKSQAGNKKEAPAKKSSKLLIIIIVAVVLLAGGGAAAFFLLKPGGGAEPVAEDTASKKKKAQESRDIFYFEMNRPLIADYPGNSEAQLFQISLALMASTQETVDALTKHQPMIQNNVLLLMGKSDPRELKTLEGKTQLRQAILEEVNRVLERMTGDDGVKEVFFTTFVMQ